ncbi:hypothetical protein H109_07452, partial [Trichophyton interdigitale MR816]
MFGSEAEEKARRRGPSSETWYERVCQYGGTRALLEKARSRSKSKLWRTSSEGEGEIE